MIDAIFCFVIFGVAIYKTCRFFRSFFIAVLTDYRRDA
ncbi:Hypothetical protein Y17_0759 [Pectobacterium wasabiae CFBP 3304]|nr:Hypothetical protein Y17_0759 [Pectobacterium wasabiae CFBP 3304]